jgi:hypothetical protein
VGLGLALALLLVAPAGCGDDSEAGSATTASSMTKAQFLKKGRAICTQVFDEIDRKYGKLSSRSSEAELNEAAQDIVLPPLTRLVDRLRALGPPRGEEARLAEILAALEAGIEEAEEEASTVRSSQGKLDKAYKMLWAYGLEECGL